MSASPPQFRSLGVPGIPGAFLLPVQNERPPTPENEEEKPSEDQREIEQLTRDNLSLSHVVENLRSELVRSKNSLMSSQRLGRASHESRERAQQMESALALARGQLSELQSAFAESELARESLAAENARLLETQRALRDEFATQVSQETDLRGASSRLTMENERLRADVAAARAQHREASLAATRNERAALECESLRRTNARLRAELDKLKDLCVSQERRIAREEVRALPRPPSPPRVTRGIVGLEARLHDLDRRAREAEAAAAVLQRALDERHTASERRFETVIAELTRECEAQAYHSPTPQPSEAASVPAPFLAALQRLARAAPPSARTDAEELHDHASELARAHATATARLRKANELLARTRFREGEAVVRLERAERRREALTRELEAARAVHGQLRTELQTRAVTAENKLTAATSENERLRAQLSEATALNGDDAARRIRLLETQLGQARRTTADAEHFVEMLDTQAAQLFDTLRREVRGLSDDARGVDERLRAAHERLAHVSRTTGNRHESSTPDLAQRNARPAFFRPLSPLRAPFPFHGAARTGA